MNGRLPRKVRRIIMALHIAKEPLSSSMLMRVTCHWPGTFYPTLDRLLRAGWVEEIPRQSAIPRYRLTEKGRQGAGLKDGAR